MFILTLVIACLLISCCSNVQTTSTSHTYFEVKRFELYNNTQGVIKFIGNVTNENGKQYLSFDINSPVPWDENLGVSCPIETRVTAKVFVELFTIREKDICKASRTFLGEFWYDITTAMGQVNPRDCPLPAGRFHVNHPQLDFQKISLQTVPLGRLRFTIKAIDNKNPAVIMWCILVEVENHLD